MKYIQKSVNANGLKQIHQFLADHHKKGGDHFNDEMLRAWAADAEFQLGEGNQASIEIRAFDSVSGHTEEFTINDDGLDCEEIEIEE
jgi:hypothetical protein